MLLFFVHTTLIRPLTLWLPIGSLCCSVLIPGNQKHVIIDVCAYWLAMWSLSRGVCFSYVISRIYILIFSVSFLACVRFTILDNLEMCILMMFYSAKTRAKNMQKLESFISALQLLDNNNYSKNCKIDYLKEHIKGIKRSKSICLFSG